MISRREGIPEKLTILRITLPNWQSKSSQYFAWKPMSRRFIWIYLGAAVLALVTARHYAGGWNDGSRLATVECLVDYGAWAIDESIYLTPGSAARPPYASGSVASQYGTFDKLLIN